MRKREFESAVRQAVEELPEEFLAIMRNVDVQVRRWPTRRQLRSVNVSEDRSLFGLYEGVPLTQRSNYNMTLPDLITIFQGPIEGSCSNPEEVVEQVRKTVVHEVAHHFGIGDAELEAWGVA